MSVFPSNIIPIFILLCFTILFHIPNVTADEVSLFEECSADDDETETYESGSPFQTNLNLLLDSLVANGSHDGYFTTSVGESPEIVYGLAQCRGDLSMEHCHACLIDAKVGITDTCSDSKNATLRYERCMLRYSDVTFFSEESTDITWTKYDMNIADDNLDGFKLKLDDLMKKITANASSIATPNRFSFDQIEYAQLEILYGAAQCTRDLSQSDCQGCLEHLFSSIPSCCNASEGASIVTATCYIKYQIEKFVEGPPGSPPISSPPESPRSSNQTFSPPSPVSGSRERPNTTKSNGNDGGKSFNVLYIIVAIIASIMLE